MPNRILKESICTSDNLDKLTPFQETVFYRLIVSCDDYGRYDARPKILAAKLFPLKDIRANQIEDALRALTSAELVTIYDVDGKPFLQMNTWDRHQIIRAKKSKFPPINESASNCNQTQSNVSVIQSESESESQSESESYSEKRARARFTPPTPEDVRGYCLENGYRVDADRFVAYYESNGWRVGRNPMKDWKAAVRNWAHNNYGGSRQQAQTPNEKARAFMEMAKREEAKERGAVGSGTTFDDAFRGLSGQ